MQTFLRFSNVVLFFLAKIVDVTFSAYNSSQQCWDGGH